jgi:hypothetical protein
MSRTRIVAAVIVAGLVATGYGAWWLHAASVMHREIDSWTDVHRAQGWQVRLDDLKVRGFPFHLEAVAQGFVIGRDLPVPWRWTGPRLSATLPPWIGHAVALSFPGSHVVEYPGPDGPKVMPVQAETATGTAHLGNDGRVDLVTVKLGMAQAAPPGFGLVKIDGLDLSLAAPPVAAAPAPSDPQAPDAGRLSITADGVELPEKIASPLGPRITRGELQLALKGALPAAPTQDALQSWRDAGGTVELEALRLQWGELQLEAKGALALDAALQPEGALTARAWGVGAAIDALVASGDVRPREGATAKVVLHGLPKPATASGLPPEVEVPLTIQDRKLFLGPVPLAHMPTVAWPSASAAH